ncbi:MAG: hypothetical protein WBE20_05500 [Candidatus Acidiferrales bacterium]
MKWMDDGVRDILHLPSDEREKLKRLDDTIQEKKKRWWLCWWGLALLGVGIAADWINPLFALAIYAVFVWNRKLYKILHGFFSALYDEYESMQRENEKLRTRTNQPDEKEMELAATVHPDGEVQNQTERQPRLGTIGFGGNFGNGK